MAAATGFLLIEGKGRPWTAGIGVAPHFGQGSRLTGTVEVSRLSAAGPAAVKLIQSPL